MKITKPQSLTTDTRLSQSHFFNNSLLNKTNLTTSSQKNNHLANVFQQYESKEADFLKVKNSQLQEKVKRMAEQIKDLQENKVYLLRLNEQYVKVVNQYYRDLHNNQQNSISNMDISVNKKLKSKETSKEKCLYHTKKQSSGTKHNSSIVDSSMAQNVLNGLERDHRNLVKHCLVMENEIKNYVNEMEKFNTMKSQLLSVNHTEAKELIAELQQSCRQNKELKKENNRLSFQLQKSKAECSKLKKTKQANVKQLNSNQEQVQKCRAQINKISQESTDKSNQYEQRIYEMELKVQKLQKQLRFGQQFVYKNQQKRKHLQIQRVESVHQNNFLKTNLTELLDPKKHPLLSLNRSFVYKKKKDKSLSLNKTVLNNK